MGNSAIVASVRFYCGLLKGVKMEKIVNYINRLLKVVCASHTDNCNRLGGDAMNSDSRDWTGYSISGNGTLHVDPRVAVKESRDYFSRNSWNPVTGDRKPPKSQTKNSDTE